MRRTAEAVKLDGWLLLVVTGLSAAAGMVAYSFTTFETQSHAKEERDGIEKRLDRIEQKIDRLLQR